MKRSAPLRSDPVKREAFIDRGRRSSARKLGRPRAISPASEEPRAKVRNLPCLVCGRERSEWVAIDPAHVVPRSLGGCSKAACVIPLCRDAYGQGCHREYDEHRLEVLPLLTLEEQAHAVSHVGISRALRLTVVDGA